MDGLLKCLEEKKTLLSELLAEVQRQAGVIAANDLEGLRESIETRQALMDKIDAIDGRIRNGSGLSAFSGNAQTEALLPEMKALLQEIRAKDDENIKNAGALVQSLMTGLRETNAEKSLLAYSTAPAPKSKFVNKKG